MNTVRTILALGAALLPFALYAPAQDPEVIDAARLKELVAGLGYEVKPLNEEAGKEKYEFTVKTTDFDVPIAAEISASKNYVWLTVFLGPAPADDSPKMAAMLKQNFKIQPTMFYITDRGNLMMGFAMENRDLSPTVLRRTVTKLSEDVGKTASVWNGSPGPMSQESL